MTGQARGPRRAWRRAGALAAVIALALPLAGCRSAPPMAAPPPIEAPTPWVIDPHGRGMPR